MQSCGGIDKPTATGEIIQVGVGGGRWWDGGSGREAVNGGYWVDNGGDGGGPGGGEGGVHCKKPAEAYTSLRQCTQPFLTHLFTLWEHNLLHLEDVHDCVLIIGVPGRRGSGITGDLSSHIEEPLLDLCTDCKRPLHERQCALFGAPRGAASWPALNSIAVSKVLQVGLWES